MKKVKKLHVIIPLMVYPFDVMVSFGETDEELEPKLEELDIDTKEDSEWKMERTCMGKAIMFPQHQTLIRMKVVPYTCADYGILSHEIFHAVTFVMDRVGIPFQLKATDEAYAYLIDYLTKEILLKINK
jgi:hypothetical protein